MIIQFHFERDLFKGYYLKEEIKIMVTEVEWVYEKYYKNKSNGKGKVNVLFYIHAGRQRKGVRQ